MSPLFEEGWPVEAIFDKFDKENQLTGLEAFAFLAASFSNATKNNYDAESLFNRISKNYDIIIKTKDDTNDDYAYYD